MYIKIDLQTYKEWYNAGKVVFASLTCDGRIFPLLFNIVLVNFRFHFLLSHFLELTKIRNLAFDENIITYWILFKQKSAIYIKCWPKR